jgi:tryptophanyl-tRNA synthetase
VAESFVAFASTFRESALGYLDDPDRLDEVLAGGAAKAAAIAEPTLALAYDRVGFLPARR